MRSRRTGAWLVALAAGMALSAQLGLAGELATPVPGKAADFIAAWQEGVWGFKGEPGCEYTFCWTSQLDYNEGADPKYEIPLIPGGEMEKRWQAIRAGLKKGQMLFDPDARCLPSGMPQLTRTGGFKMVVEKDRIYLIYGGDQKFRIIWMDGREMPKKQEYQYTFNGDSIGHWDEDGNLVIETGNIIGDDKAVGPHLPMGNNFWVKEIWTPVSADEIETQVTMMDVDNWTRPHTETWHYTRNAEGDIGPQTVCINGEGQRYFEDPGTGAYELSGPGGKPLEKAED